MKIPVGASVAGSIAYTPKQNQFGDTLPIIPSDSRVMFDSPLYRLDIEIIATRMGAAAAHQHIQFQVTGVEVKNVGKHKQDFLFGGKGICMEGTGLGSDGKYIAITNPKSVSWNPGYAGVANPDSIPPYRHRVNILGPRALGERRGDDTGGAVKGHHFDNYVGPGQAAMDAWEAAGGNIATAQVKYLGK